MRLSDLLEVMAGPGFESMVRAYNHHANWLPHEPPFHSTLGS